MRRDSPGDRRSCSAFTSAVSYEQAEIQPQSCDVFVAFTDGISEAMNSEEQERREEQLIECVRKCKNIGAMEMIAIIIAAPMHLRPAPSSTTV
jgi:serine phosphatase RsbU (regulator of sigma subunit)